MTDQPPPWPGYSEGPGTSPCWIHYRNEPVTRRTYIVCFECGHSWTRRKLRQEWRRGYLSVRLEGESRLSSWRSVLLKRAKDIFFCPGCLHDF